MRIKECLVFECGMNLVLHTSALPLLSQTFDYRKCVFREINLLRLPSWSRKLFGNILRKKFNFSFDFYHIVSLPCYLSIYACNRCDYCGINLLIIRIFALQID